MNQKGYALPVVMAISMIIMAFTLSVAFSTRQKIEIISELKDHSQVRLKSYSAFNETMYNILISNFTSTEIKIILPNGKWKPWNLYGEPIVLNDSVTVKLRDTAGMISPVMQPGYMAALFSGTGASSATVNSFLDKLSDWQDTDDLKRLNGAESWEYRTTGYPYTPRNFFIQTIDEIRLIKDFANSILDAVRDDLTYWGNDHINYLTMSEKTLRAVLKNDRVIDSILKMRNDHILTGSYFTGLTGIQRTDTVMFAPSGTIKMDITAKLNAAVDRIETVIAKRETQEGPYMVFEWKK